MSSYDSGHYTYIIMTWIILGLWMTSCDYHWSRITYSYYSLACEIVGWLGLLTFNSRADLVLYMAQYVDAKAHQASRHDIVSRPVKPLGLCWWPAPLLNLTMIVLLLCCYLPCQLSWWLWSMFHHSRRPLFIIHLQTYTVALVLSWKL